MRTVLGYLTHVTKTPAIGLMVVIASIFGVKDREGSIYDKAPRWWASLLVRAAGIRVRLHNEQLIRSGEPRLYLSNHVSWCDVLTLASVLPRYKFIGKAELFRIPIFGRAARAAFPALEVGASIYHARVAPDGFEETAATLYGVDAQYVATVKPLGGSV